MAASYVNFYVANTTVTVPVYGDAERRSGAEARSRRSSPAGASSTSRRASSSSAGGAFHCISQQQPAGGRG